MKLQKGVKYILKDIKQHENCQGCDKCSVLSLMDKGFIPGEQVEVLNSIGSLVNIQVGCTQYVVRESDIECCTFQIDE